MKKAKIISSILCLVMILTGCGGKENEAQESSPQQPASASAEGTVQPGSDEDQGQPDELTGEYTVNLVRYGTYLYPSYINPNFAGRIVLEKGGGLFSFGEDTVIDDWFCDGGSVAMMMGETMIQLPWDRGVITYDADENVTLYFSRDDGDLTAIPLCSFDGDIPAEEDIPGEYCLDFTYYDGDGLAAADGNRAVILINEDGTGLLTDGGKTGFTWTLNGADVTLDMAEGEDMILSHRGGILSREADGMTAFYVDRKNGADLSWLPSLEDIFGAGASEEPASAEAAEERVLFKDIMGVSGYYVERAQGESYPFFIRTYYADLGNGYDIIAESYGFEIDDSAADIDGDGVTELLCSCQYGGDGHCELNVFRLADGKPQVGIVYPDDLDLEDYYNWGVNSYATYYDSEIARMILEYTSEKDNSVTNTRVLTIDDLTFRPFTGTGMQ